MDLTDEMVNPLTISHTTGTKRPNSRQKEQRRNSSTFSSYYLNNKAKELASLVTIDDRQKEFGAILEQDFEADQLITLPDRKSKAPDGKTTATRAMFSFKSELHSLIGNLQGTTQE